MSVRRFVKHQDIAGYSDVIVCGRIMIAKDHLSVADDLMPAMMRDPRVWDSVSKNNALLARLKRDA